MEEQLVKVKFLIKKVISILVIFLIVKDKDLVFNILKMVRNMKEIIIKITNKVLVNTSI
jgi:hypothetical protein